MNIHIDDHEPEAVHASRDPRCGTPAGRVAHAKRKEPACEDCRAARRAARIAKRLEADPNYIPPAGSVDEKLRRNVRAEGECLVWTAGHHDKGWGLVRVDGVNKVAHRVAYEQAHGPLAEGMVVQHSCGRRNCVRLEHLSAVHKQHDATPENLRSVLLSRREIDESGCWNYTGRLNTYGYGLVGGSHFTHRVAYETWRGPIPDGLHIDHLCRNRRCFNPDHLEPVTQQENTRRGFAARTTCPSGHVWTPENTHINRRGARVCRECDRARRRRTSRSQGSESMDDDDAIRDAHSLSCAIWTTSFDPCDCLATSPRIPRLTTAQRLDLIHPASDPFEAA